MNKYLQIIIVKYSLNMIGLLIILGLYIIYELYTGKLTICNTLGLITICILRLGGREFYHLIDIFIQNNIWVFLLLVCVISIYAIRR
jgi:hypothetical protein